MREAENVRDCAIFTKKLQQCETFFPWPFRGNLLCIRCTWPCMRKHCRALEYSPSCWCYRSRVVLKKKNAARHSAFLLILEHSCSGTIRWNKTPCLGFLTARTLHVIASFDCYSQIRTDLPWKQNGTWKIPAGLREKNRAPCASPLISIYLLTLDSHAESQSASASLNTRSLCTDSDQR